jgi:hypothetical protein
MELYRAIGEQKDHGLYDFLQRPIIIGSGAWASSQAAGTIINSWSLPDALFSAATSQNSLKVRGFVGFKASVRIRVQVNSQPFQAGCLLMHYMPYAGYMKAHDQWYAGTTTNLTAATACPSVILNLSTATSFEFVTPYMSPYLYVNLVTGEGTFGKVYLSVLSALSHGGTTATKLNFTVFANFENIELRFPTVAPPVTTFAQAGGEIAEMEKQGVTSRAVSAIGTIARGVLPVFGMSSLVRPVDYITDSLSSVLKIFGYSKPAVTAPVTRIIHSPTRYLMNYDGSFQGHKLAFSNCNELQNFSGFCNTDVDEMNFANVCGRSTYVTDFPWTDASTNDAGYVLFTQTVSPAFGIIGTSAPQTNGLAISCNMTPYAKVASMFSQWRGDFVYTLRFVKTQFHSGRIRISFVPYLYSLTGITNYTAELGYTYTEDVDLATSTDFSFRVPFVSTRPWLQTYLDDPATTADSARAATGMIVVSVINPLVFPGTVASTIRILLFAHMENAQFSAPINPSFFPALCPNVAQVGLEIVKEHSEVDEKHNMQIAPASMCTGEIVTSFRQLLKTYSYLGTFKPTYLAATTTSLGRSGRQLLVFPWAPCTPINDPLVVPTASPWTWSPLPGHVDYYSHAYAQYAFFRGSMRFMVVTCDADGNLNIDGPPVKVSIVNFSKGVATPYRPEQTPSTGTASNLTNGPVSQFYDTPFVFSGTGAPTSFPPSFHSVSRVIDVIQYHEGVVEFEVPYYSTGHMTPTNYAINNSSTVRQSVAPLPIVVLHGLSRNYTYRIYRAVGDDFEFGCRLGVPPQYYFYKSAVAPNSSTVVPS